MTTLLDALRQATQVDCDTLDANGTDPTTRRLYTD